MALWLGPDSPDSDVAVSTRVRLARNIAHLPFPHRLDAGGAQKVKTPARQAFLPEGSDYKWLEMSAVAPLYRRRMIEQHLISRELAASDRGAVVLSPDTRYSIMMMEEDHYRLQFIKGGFDVDTSLKACMELERLLGRQTQFAYHDTLGYLTACPTNVGTGMRVSVMLHLKALSVTRVIGSILPQLGQFGVTVRGTYGEGSNATGALYQVSNQVTLGVGEEGIAKNLKAIVQELIAKEREMRGTLLEKSEVELKDQVMRAYGVLRYASKMGSQEALDLLSLLALGVSMEMVDSLKLEDLYNLMMDIMPAMLSDEGKTQNQRDQDRAALIQKTMDKR